VHIFVATYQGGSYYTLKQIIRKISKKMKGGSVSEAINEYISKKS
jgi:hypothetical protein